MRTRVLSQEIFGEPLSPALVKRMVGMADLGLPAEYHLYLHDDTLTFGGDITHDDGSTSYLRREYNKNQDGTIDVHHAIFKMSNSQRSKGTGKQVAEYEKLPVRTIKTEAAWDGQYVWPNMGFTLRNPADLVGLQDEFHNYLVNEMLLPSDVAKRAAKTSKTIQELAHTQVEGRQVGKQFLLERGNADGHLIELHVRPGKPEWASFKAYLDGPSKPAR